MTVLRIHGLLPREPAAKLCRSDLVDRMRKGLASSESLSRVRLALGSLLSPRAVEHGGCSPSYDPLGRVLTEVLCPCLSKFVGVAQQPAGDAELDWSDSTTCLRPL